MSNINTVYAYFDTYNYENLLKTTSYALPFATFTFIPRLETADRIFSTQRVVWDFGDGTIMEAVTARHAYTTAGNYKVTCSLYTGDGQCYINTYHQIVDIYDFIPNNINISVSNPASFGLISGQISQPIHITNSISYQHLNGITDNKTIVAFSSGSDDNYFELGLDKQPYGHLQPYSSFYQYEVGLNGLTDYFEIPSFKTVTTPIYCKLVGTNIVYTDITDTNAFFCGVTGYQDVYFKSDTPRSQVNLFFGYQPGEMQEFNNTSTVGISASVIENIDYALVSINSNGITSEGQTSDIFPIGTNKFGNTKIGFVAKAKDSTNYTNKVGPLVDLNDITVDLKLSNGASLSSYITITPNFGILSSLNAGCFFKGYVSVNLNTSFLIVGGITYYAPYNFRDVNISVTGFFNGNYITGQSNNFNLYSKDYYNVAKKGEDIDMTQQFKDIAMQPLFLDNPVLFDDFMGSIVGNLSSSVGTTLGKRTYEKIQNFVDNNSTLDYAGIQSLVSLIKMVGDNNVQFDNSNYLYPADIGRLIDLLSINFNRLRGFADSYNYDFKTYGYEDREIYGSNLGKEISTLNYIVTAGIDLVAFEKYSGIFTRLNTYLPLVASLSASFINSSKGTYALSSYNSTWGWGLVVPDGTTSAKLGTYYLFYEHNPTINGTITNSVINYKDVTNTLNVNVSSYTDWSQPNGIISNIISNQLYTGLNLFN